MFIKAGRYAATSTHMGYYNGVANSEAYNVAGLAALGTTWLDIGSTASVRATWHLLFWMRFGCRRFFELDRFRPVETTSGRSSMENAGFPSFL